MLASRARGKSVLHNTAQEPEVKALASGLNQFGAKISGAGTSHIEIEGVDEITGGSLRVIPDRIEAGTYILMAAATKSSITLKNVCYAHLMVLADKLNQAGVKVTNEGGLIKVKPKKSIKPIGVTTHPYPGFPTDLQAQFMAFMSLTPGVSVITDKIYPDRFMHIAELNRMGANIRRDGSNAVVEGVKKLHGAPIMASDLRASAALIIAGLAAKGKTEIHRLYHLDRGYENLDTKLTALGAKVYREEE